MNENTSNLNEIEFEKTIEEENGPIEIPPQKRQIYTDKGDPEIISLYDDFKNGELFVQPDFQRHFVWDANK